MGEFFQGGADFSAPLAVCFVDNVEKLSTENVDNYISLRYISVEMWKTIYRADISVRYIIYRCDIFVDNVEKLSTAIVDNYISPRYIDVSSVTLMYRADTLGKKCGKVIHRKCGKLYIAAIY